MTTTAQPATARPAADWPLRAGAARGLGGWLFTVDHKRIGILYLYTTFIFFVLGGILALLLRLQLAAPDQRLLSAAAYNQIFTMHGTTMIFLFVIPVLAGFGNYLVPLMIGARDMAFPRLNALSYWLLLGGGLVLYGGLLAEWPAAGWTGYTPLSTRIFTPGPGIDLWIAGLQLVGASSLLGAANFLVTIATLRAPGMTLTRLPLFVVAQATTALMVLLATPALTAGLTALLLDRQFGFVFFRPGAGADPVLWQHLFWFYSHPAVYIMILPAMGMISEILPVFSRKPIFGYAVVAASTFAIGLLGFGVWFHHMFAIGASPLVDALFMAASLFIAVPTGVKIFNWIGTLWGGSLLLRTPLAFAAAFLAMFTIGGITGVMVALVPFDWQVTDTYFVVNHIHYVLFGGSVFGIFAGLYYWVPKMSGRLLDERLGWWHFWLLVAGFNLTFMPMLVLGLLGMPRRIYTYPSGAGWDVWNLLATIGAFLIALAVLLFIVNFWNSVLRGRGAPAGDDPWEGNTLEWLTTSPPPVYNFAEIPAVRSRRPLWDRRHLPEPAPKDDHDHPAE